MAQVLLSSRMVGHTALVLGAGFSRPAGGPLLRELLDDDLVGRSSADQASMAALRALLAQRSNIQPDFSLEDLFTDVWLMARTGGAYTIDDSEWDATDLLDQLLIHLASVCGSVHIRRGTNLWDKYLSYLSYLLNESKTLTIVSFNYDLLLEQCLGDDEVRYDYGPSPDFVFDSSRRQRALSRSGAHLSILKLHGSSNWGVCRGCQKADRADDLVVAYESPYIPTRRRSCPYCNERYLVSGIVPPIQGKAGETRHLTEVWKKARHALKRTRELVAIGYSLPSSDLEAQSLMREVVALAKRPRITVVSGPSGAPASYSKLLPKYIDAKCYFEDYLDAFPQD